MQKVDGLWNGVEHWVTYPTDYSIIESTASSYNSPSSSEIPSLPIIHFTFTVFYSFHFSLFIIIHIFFSESFACFISLVIFFMLTKLPFSSIIFCLTEDDCLLLMRIPHSPVSPLFHLKDLILSSVSFSIIFLPQCNLASYIPYGGAKHLSSPSCGS